MPNTNHSPNDENLPEYLRGVSDKTKVVPLSQATPLKAKMAQSRGKPVPLVFSHLLKLEYVRQFPLIDRLKILFGANLVIMCGIATRHNPGEFQPLIIGKVSNALSATDHMKHIVSSMLDDRDPKSPVVHEPEQKKEPEIL